MLVVLQRMGFTYAPELSTAVVELRLNDGPAVLVDEEATLGIDVPLAALESRLDFPDTVKLVARQILIDVTGLDDVLVLQVTGGDLVTVVGMYSSFLPISFQS